MEKCATCPGEARPNRKTCETCAARARAYYIANRDRLTARQRAWNRENRPTCNAAKKRFIARHPERQVLRSMIKRCTMPHRKEYVWYGARGIKVCDRWREPNGRGFWNFLADMGPRPSPQHSIDRIDVNGNYEPGNCKWSTAKEQRANQRRSKEVRS